MAVIPHPFDFCAFRTAPTAGEVLPARVTFPLLTRLVAEELELDHPAQIWGRNRQARAVFARNAVWWLAKRWTKLSFPLIARLSTSKYRNGVPMDHSTVIHGVRRLEAWRDGTARYADLVPYAEWLRRRGPL